MTWSIINDQKLSNSMPRSNGVLDGALNCEKMIEGSALAAWSVTKGRRAKSAADFSKNCLWRRSGAGVVAWNCFQLALVDFCDTAGIRKKWHLLSRRRARVATRRSDFLLEEWIIMADVLELRCSDASNISGNDNISRRHNREMRSHLSFDVSCVIHLSRCGRHEFLQSWLAS